MYVTEPLKCSQQLMTSQFLEVYEIVRGSLPFLPQIHSIPLQTQLKRRTNCKQNSTGYQEIQLFYTFQNQGYRHYPNRYISKKVPSKFHHDIQIFHNVYKNEIKEIQSHKICLSNTSSFIPFFCKLNNRI